MSNLAFDFAPALEALREMWLGMRDGAGAEAMNAARTTIRFARKAGILGPDQEELWLRRIQTCPGHDDEGGRDWCAYCGTMTKGAPDAPAPDELLDGQHPSCLLEQLAPELEPSAGDRPRRSGEQVGGDLEALAHDQLSARRAGGCG